SPTTESRVSKPVRTIRTIRRILFRDQVHDPSGSGWGAAGAELRPFLISVRNLSTEFAIFAEFRAGSGLDWMQGQSVGSPTPPLAIRNLSAEFAEFAKFRAEAISANCANIAGTSAGRFEHANPLDARLAGSPHRRLRSPTNEPRRSLH